MIVLILEESDKELADVKELISGLNDKEVDWQYIKHPSKYSYRDLERQLESADLVVIVIGRGIVDTTWVHVCTQSCWALKKYRQSGSFDYVGLSTDKYLSKDNPSESNFSDNSKIVQVRDILQSI